MEASAERRLLQAAVAVGCLVPIAAGAAGIASGPAMIAGIDTSPADLDSHFRYLSGLLLAIGLAFAACIPRIERRSLVFGLLGCMVISGGLARLLSLLAAGAPSAPHLLGLAMELGIVPLLLLWQRRVARLFA